jgi:hypothetical protein
MRASRRPRRSRAWARRPATTTRPTMSWASPGGRSCTPTLRPSTSGAKTMTSASACKHDTSAQSTLMLMTPFARQKSWPSWFACWACRRLLAGDSWRPDASLQLLRLEPSANESFDCVMEAWSSSSPMASSSSSPAPTPAEPATSGTADSLTDFPSSPRLSLKEHWTLLKDAWGYPRGYLIRAPGVTVRTLQDALYVMVGQRGDPSTRVTRLSDGFVIVAGVGELRALAKSMSSAPGR